MGRDMCPATDVRHLASLYLDAKRAVVQRGFGWEIDWQASLEFDRLTESTFLQEAAWVVLTAGMRESVVRRRFNDVSEAFFQWSSAKDIVDSRRQCRHRALAVFNHRAKIEAILGIAHRTACLSFEWIKSRILEQGVSYLRRLPFIGPVTSFHLAKNIGLQTAKPDRHLVRIAALFGFPSAQTMCETIAQEVCDSVSVIDVVLWRYATLHIDYNDRLRHAYLAMGSSTCNTLCPVAI